MVNKKIKFAARWAVSFGLLFFLLLKVDWSALVGVLKTTDLKFFLSSTIAAFFGNLFLGAKYYVLIKGTALDRPLLSVVRIHFISRFYGLFLPSFVGSDMVRWFKMTRDRGGRSFFLASTIFERVTFVFLLVLSAAVPMVLFPAHPGISALRDRLMPLMAALLALLAAAFFYFVHPGFQTFLHEKFKGGLGGKDRWPGLVLFLDNFSIRNTSLSMCVRILGLGLCWQLLFIVRMVLLFYSLSLPVGFADVVWISSFVLLLQILPVSIGGIGVREGAYAYLLTLFGLPPEQGASVGILFFLQVVLFALIGGIFEMRGEEEAA